MAGIGERELFAAVDARFKATGRGLSPWPNPHPGLELASEEEYSRWTDPAKWRIVGARADAWIDALVETGLADRAPDAIIRWQFFEGAWQPPTDSLGRTDRLTPKAAGAIPLTVARAGFGIEGSVGDERVFIAVGDPAIFVVDVPDCGCDACDSGSQPALDELDTHIRGIVLGRFRHLSRGRRQITVIDEESWRAHGGRGSGGFRRGEVRAILADPAGWEEAAGASWLETA